MNIEPSELAALMQQGQPAQDNAHWKVGDPYGIRTVTMVYTGRVVKVTDKEIILKEAAWVADTGRFHQFAANGTIADSAEVEPYHPDQEVIIGRGAILDAFAFRANLPTVQQ